MKRRDVLKALAALPTCPDLCSAEVLQFEPTDSLLAIVPQQHLSALQVERLAKELRQVAGLPPVTILPPGTQLQVVSASHLRESGIPFDDSLSYSPHAGRQPRIG